MPTFLTHPAVPLALGLGLGEPAVSRRLLVAGTVVSLLPDLDVVGLTRGVPYGSALGHRGATHALAVAVLLAVAGALLHRLLRTKRWTAFAFLLAAAASHGLLDALTNGGLGVALLWPFSEARFFSPVRLIQVAPLRSALWTRGVAAVESELLRVWAPCALAAGVLVAWRWGRTQRPAG